MLLWTIEHRVFAHDSYVKNYKSITAVRHIFRRHFTLHRNQAVSSRKTIVCWVNAVRTQSTV